MQMLDLPMRDLNQVFSGLNNSAKLEFWHLLKLPPLLSTHFLQLVELNPSAF